MTKLFLDTSYLIALEAADDQHHGEAMSDWQVLGASSPQLLTTSYVFNEVVTFFNSRGRHAKAAELGAFLLDSASVEVVHVEESLFQESWRYFLQHVDKSYSLTDCVSFAVMRRLRVTTALTFDQHFTRAGFERRPSSVRRSAH